MNRLLLLLVFILNFLSRSLGQTVTLKEIELAGEAVIVHYNLEHSNSAQTFIINLYESKDGFASPLTKVSGDIGSAVVPGRDKKIVWKIRDEYGFFKGRLSVEIRGRLYTPFISVKDFDATKTRKVGKPYDITWKPGNSDPVNIELYKGNQRIQGDMTQPNNGAYTLHIPSTIKAGAGYRIKFTDSRSPDEVVYTADFKISPKIPTVLKVVVPLVVVGGIVAVVTSSGGNDKETDTSGNGEIIPPDLP